MRVGAKQADHDALNNEFGGGRQIGIVWIFRAQERTPALHEEAFESGFPIDERGYDVAWTRLAERQENNITIENAGTGHGVAANRQGEERCGDTRVAVAQKSGGNRDIAVRLLFSRSRRSGRNDAVERDFHDLRWRFAPRFDEGARFAGDPCQDAFFLQCLQMAGGCERAGEAKVSLDFPQRGVMPVLALMSPHIIENRLLFGSEHSVQLNTMRGAAS